MTEMLAEILARADSLYDKRSEIESVRQSVELLESADDARDYEVAWRLGRALFFLGQEAEREDERRAFHSRGASVCQRASQDQPFRVEAHFWLGVNLALLAQTEKLFRALRHALAARSALRLAARIDSTYHAAAPLRVLARLEHKLPKILGGSRARARANFQRAIVLAPANTVTRIYFAEMLIEEGKAIEAKEQLEEILRAPVDPAWAFEMERDRRAAERYLGRLE
ncbi:MAG: hypothetical protein AUG51_16745 [Acidobacteria bacterium 13_1_20CM_3_53_8]|nr:MAG: hypothetical protein AUG51_16745 [Acidobacteria bacterium 13_1_20CM_3_53_8]